MGADSQVDVIRPPRSMGQEAARRFVDVAHRAIQSRGSFYVALSGGNTPRAMYEALSSDNLTAGMNWEKVHIFFSDERFVPPDSPESNFHTARQSLLSKVNVPEDHIHSVATVNVSPERSASLYEETLREVFHVDGRETPRFDLVMLGIGPDGHTASLFPETEALSARNRLVVANFVPKLDAWRITFTFDLINAAASVMFLVAGEDKADPVSRVLSGERELPAALVQTTSGKVLWLLDAAAAGKIDGSGPALPSSSQ